MLSGAQSAALMRCWGEALCCWLAGSGSAGRLPSKASKGNRYLRAKASGGTVAIPGEGNTEAHSSGSLSAMIGCNCLVELPAGSGPVKPGEEVEVLSFVH